MSKVTISEIFIPAESSVYIKVVVKLPSSTPFIEWDNITKGSTVKIKAEHPVLVFINYNKAQSYYPQGVDLIPGLTPPVKRGLPEAPTLIVAISGVIIAADVIFITVGKRSMVELF